jgi:hypothetical protein
MAATPMDLRTSPSAPAEVDLGAGEDQPGTSRREPKPHSDRHREARLLQGRQHTALFV